MKTRAPLSQGAFFYVMVTLGKSRTIQLNPRYGSGRHLQNTDQPVAPDQLGNLELFQVLRTLLETGLKDSARLVYLKPMQKAWLEDFFKLSKSTKNPGF